MNETLSDAAPGSPYFQRVVVEDSAYGAPNASVFLSLARSGDLATLHAGAVSGYVSGDDARRIAATLIAAAARADVRNGKVADRAVP